MKNHIKLLFSIGLTIYTPFALPMEASLSLPSPLFTADKKPTEPLKNILQICGIEADSQPDILKATQKAWLRPLDLERWQMENKYEEKRVQLIPHLKNLNMVNEIQPLATRYDYIFILGGLLKRAKARMDYAEELIKKGIRGDIEILSSDRTLDPQEEPAEFFKASLTKDWIPTTENNMMNWLASNIGSYGHVTAQNSMRPDGKEKRATTSDTIKRWASIQQPRPGSTCLVISNQPLITYQEAVVRTHLPATIAIEAVGPAMDENERICEILDSLARRIYQENEQEKLQV